MAGSYFFVSYAQVPPLEGEAPRSDPLVDAFFSDLVDRVGVRASDSSRRIGVYDRALERDSDWAAAVRRALGEAEVFVPLNSPRYASGTWTRHERRSFEERLRAAHADPETHIQPVLWMPFPSGADAPEADDLGDDIPEYRAMGLGALCDVVRSGDPGTASEYRDAYDRVVDRLAQRIVDAAEHSPIGPSAAPAEPGAVAPAAADFVIAVHAPASGSAPPGGDPAAYGAGPVDWSPFAATRPVPIVQQARYVTQRLDVNATVTAAADGPRLWGTKPAILLVDVWLAADRDGAAALQRILKAKPAWVLPIAVADSDPPDATVDPARAAAARARTIAMLTDAGADPLLAAAVGYDGFMDVMPTLVTRARRRFFKELPRTYPRRPRLRGSDTERSAAEGEGR